MTDETSLSIRITNYIIENFELAESQKGKLKAGEFNFSGNGLPKRFCNYFLSDRRYFNDFAPEFLILNDEQIRDIVTDVIPNVVDGCIDHLRQTKVKQLNLESGSAMSIDTYKRAIPVIDIQNPRGEALMVDRDTLDLLDICEKGWERVMGPGHVKLINETPGLKRAGRFEYNPRTDRRIRQEKRGAGSTDVYNTYMKPDHLVKPEPIELNPVFIKFLDTFFLGSCKEYALNWMYHSLFNKMETYLVLVGAGGTGKNLLAESMKYLHGVDNFTKAPASALDSKFNGHLAKCTMVYYDECKFSADGSNGNSLKKNRLKEWANGHVSVEKKGQDARNENIYCSGIIATNNDSDIHLDRLDRKFSVMEITPVRLEKRLGVKEARELWEYITNPGFGHAFYNYLRKVCDPNFEIYTEYRGSKFDELVLTSLSNWQQELLNNYILPGDAPEYSYKSLSEEIPFFPRNKAKVNDFLRSFEYEGHTLGKVVSSGRIDVIKVDTYFIKDKESIDLNGKS